MLFASPDELQQHNRAAWFDQAAFIGETGDEGDGLVNSKKGQIPHMAKRAVLLDRDNVVIAHMTYTEMDQYIERGLVERLSSIKASTHKFRLIDPSEQKQEATEVFDELKFDQSSLTAADSRANAGVADRTSAILWARRRVRIWPTIGDTRAPRVSCRGVKPQKSVQRQRRRG